MAAKLYKWSDASAPQLASTGSTSGSLYDILKAVLINGYGTRVAVPGFTVTFDDAPNNKLVIKLPTQNSYLWVNDNIDYRWAYTRMYDSMSSIDVGVNEVPNSLSFGTFTQHFFPKRYTASADAAEWHMLVETTGKWFYYWTNGATYPQGFFWGEIEYHNPTHPHSPVMLGGPSDTTANISGTDGRAGLFDSSAGHWYMQNDPYNYGERGGTKVRAAYDTIVVENPNPVDGKFYMQPYTVESVSAPICSIGKMPNLLRSFGTINTYAFPNKSSTTVAGVKYMSVNYTSGAVYLFEYDTDTL